MDFEEAAEGLEEAAHQDPGKGVSMKSILTRKKMLHDIDAERIKKAIEEAERQTSGEIRVSVAPLFWGSAMHAAERAFERLGMTQTKDRNAVLFFVIPARHRLVLLGDVGIHEKVGQEFWECVVGLVTDQFKRSNYTEGLVQGIQEVSRQLAEHFPHDPETDKNELPDSVEFGVDHAP